MTKDNTIQENKVCINPNVSVDINMSKSKLPKMIKVTVAIFSSHCPMCGAEAQDKRYKKRSMSAHTLTNRRFTNRTITRECRICGLRFSFTWKTFVNALRKKAEQEKTNEGKNFVLKGTYFIEDWLDEKYF